MKQQITRRKSLALFAATWGAVSLGPSVLRSIADEPGSNTKKIGLGFSLYGMPGITIDKALALCAEIGYDDVELSLLPGSPTEPSALDGAQRAALNKQIGDLNLHVSALMVNLPLMVDETAQQANLDRLKAAAELAHTLAPDAPPIVETVLGGKPSEWPSVRDVFAERLRAWAKVGESTRTVIAFKAHVNNALHTPEDAHWLVEQVGSPWLKLAYDYSHFASLPIGLEPSMQLLLPDTVFVHVKDRAADPGRVQFLLPGEGSTDYAEYFRLLNRFGYRGSVMVEVSAQVFKQPGYDAERAARKSYEHLSAAMRQAGLR